MKNWLQCCLAHKSHTRFIDFLLLLLLLCASCIYLKIVCSSTRRWKEISVIFKPLYSTWVQYHECSCYTFYDTEMIPVRHNDGILKSKWIKSSNQIFCLKINEMFFLLCPPFESMLFWEKLMLLTLSIIFRSFLIYVKLNHSCFIFQIHTFHIGFFIFLVNSHIFI